MDQSREKNCIQRALAGELDAFDRLMAAWEGRLFSFLRLRGLSHADAQDVLQETFLQAYRHLRSYRSKWRFSTWLFTIAVRQAGRIDASKGPGRDDQSGFLPEQTPVTPQEQYLGEEQRQSVWGQARRLLSDEQFTALWLFYGEEFEVAEIARALRRSSPWVKVNLHRARKRLQNVLPAAMPDERHQTELPIDDATIRT